MDMPTGCGPVAYINGEPVYAYGQPMYVTPTLVVRVIRKE